MQVNNNESDENDKESTKATTNLNLIAITDQEKEQFRKFKKKIQLKEINRAKG